ncbi:glycoside hydrolase [Anaeromyces robustus]|uniref:Beta-xylanase n=1 Tax=Anaeromyces robustus TaxID=1754192 RepID=A0A1Y1UYZ8_9FUNG|nr:glycoside hydrolase [Anaeromyces robustus]|eukprot:ORX43068.1 glycoside hydrolase [Anaeromyces robustus]
MRSYLKKISILALAAAANAKNIKRDPYWIKMADVIQQVRPDFYFGVATTKSFFANPKYKDIMSTYNLQVGGTETFNTKPCDDSIAFAKKLGAKFRGHNLFWPAYSPSWFKTYSSDIEEVKEYYLDYVAKVLDHYKDEEDIIYWINEFKGWDTYTEDIFKVAREHTNKNVKLFYNDYNAENNNGNYNGKTGAVFNYIKSMREKDVPIDGVGLQMHISCNYYPNYDQLYELISQYEEIGVEVHITEIDVSMKSCSTLEDQKKLYMDVFKACFDHSNCKVFTVWGAYDSESWVGAENINMVLYLHTDNEFNAGKLHLEVKIDQAWPINVIVHTTNDESVTLQTIEDLEPDTLKSFDFDVPAVKGDNYNRISVQDAWGKALTITITNFYFVPSAEASQGGETGNTDGQRYDIIKEGDYMINGKWQNWSWVTVTLFGKGTLYFKAMVNDTRAQLQVLFHTTGDEYVNVGSFSKFSDSELVQYSVNIKEPTGDKYDRITIQDVANNGLTLYLNDVYFIAASEEEEEPTATQPIEEEPTATDPATEPIEDEPVPIDEPSDEPIAEGIRYDIFKKGDKNIDSKWQNWSWGVADAKVDKNGYFVNYITAESWGGVSFKRSDSTLFGKGTFYFKAMTNDTNAVYQVIFHSGSGDDEETLNLGSVKNLSDKKMTLYSLEGTTLYLGDVFFIAAEEKEEPIDENCWASALGFKCCKTTSTVIFEDQDGSWGIEDDFWCGYPCCEDSNVVYAVDENGIWGYENKHWCGITKANKECEFNALGYSCCPDAAVVFEDDHKWGYVNNKWCGVSF